MYETIQLNINMSKYCNIFVYETSLPRLTCLTKNLGMRETKYNSGFIFGAKVLKGVGTTVLWIASQKKKLGFDIIPHLGLCYMCPLKLYIKTFLIIKISGRYYQFSLDPLIIL